MGAGLPRDRIRTIYIDGAISDWPGKLMHRTHQGFRILAVGRLQEHKGFQYLIDAVPEMVSKTKELKVIIAGNGPYRRKLSKLVSRLGIRDFVSLVGYRDQKSLSSLYEWADVVIIPTVTPEPFGRVAVEAMSRGKPVIGSDVGGIPEVVKDGETGFLVRSANPFDLAEKVLLLVERPDLRREIGERAFDLCRERFNQDLITEQVCDVYEEVRGILA